MAEFTVLGIGADPRMYGYRPVSSLAASENAYEYISVHSDKPSWFWVLLFEGGLLDLVVEVFFGLLLEL
jgi:hypothetical protein